MRSSLLGPKPSNPATLPGWLEPVADHNPFTRVTNAGRALFNGLDVGADLWWSLGWSIGLILVFSTLSIRRFHQATA